MGMPPQVRRDAVEVTVDGRSLVLVEDTDTDGEDGAPQSVRRWARDAASDVEVTTLTTRARVPTASLVQAEVLGLVMVRGMERAVPRDELTAAVRDAASIVPEARPDAVDLDGSPAGALVVQVDGCTVAGLVDGATTVVVTSTGPGRPGVRLAG